MLDRIEDVLLQISKLILILIIVMLVIWIIISLINLVVFKDIYNETTYNYFKNIAEQIYEKDTTRDNPNIDLDSWRKLNRDYLKKYEKIKVYPYDNKGGAKFHFGYRTVKDLGLEFCYTFDFKVDVLNIQTNEIEKHILSIVAYRLKGEWKVNELYFNRGER